jgi:hypothetical protein
MRTISLPEKRLLNIFSKRKIATMNELKKGLGTQVSMTVFRKLKQLNYISSCSHSGRYYTLEKYADFNSDGLWFCRSVLFSSHGNLLETITSLVESSERGITASELERCLKVKPNEALLTLLNSGRIYREKLNGVYVSFSINDNIRKKQKLFRSTSEKELRFDVTPDVLMNELKAGIVIFFSTLNEKQRRLYAGLESLKLGREGDKVISDLLDINIKTVSKGKRELLENAVHVDTIRSSGGGRKKKRKAFLI